MKNNIQINPSFSNFFYFCVPLGIFLYVYISLFKLSGLKCTYMYYNARSDNLRDFYNLLAFIQNKDAIV